MVVIADTFDAERPPTLAADPEPTAKEMDEAQALVEDVLRVAHARGGPEAEKAGAPRHPMA